MARPVVNDFSITVATVNGSGSQTANTVLLRAIFQMGIPVSGKNLFPSNIAGLPTWFTIRVSRDGYVARRRDSDIMVVMNPETAAQDIAAIGPGGIIVLHDQIAAPEIPADRHVVRVPMAIPYGLGLLNQVLARAGYTPMLTPGKVREFYHNDWVCDPGPIMARTAWRPAVPLREGFAATVAWYRRQGWL